MSKSDLFDPHHPVWNIVRLVVVFIGLTLLLFLNADRFDQGELVTILEMLALVSGFEFFRHKVGKVKNGEDSKDS